MRAQLRGESAWARQPDIDGRTTAQTGGDRRARGLVNGGRRAHGVMALTGARRRVAGLWPRLERLKGARRRGFGNRDMGQGHAQVHQQVDHCPGRVRIVRGRQALDVVFGIGQLQQPAGHGARPAHQRQQGIEQQPAELLVGSPAALRIGSGLAFCEGNQAVGVGVEPVRGQVAIEQVLA